MRRSRPLLGDVLFGELEREAASGTPELDNRLWAEVVFAFVRAALEDRAPVTRLAQMPEPLFWAAARCVESARSPAPAVDRGRCLVSFSSRRRTLHERCCQKRSDE